MITWKTTHELDPYSAISGASQPIQIEVIALPWKWLFIYPEQQIATVNYLQIPLAQQVEFLMTTDNVPMSAFFIPQLGSQIYVMAGMRTKLHLLANEIGTYDGLNTQYNGSGFSDMHFVVNVVKPEEMQAWYDQIKSTASPLDEAAYQKLLIPSEANPPSYYSTVTQNYLDKVISLYLNFYSTHHPRYQQTT
jgi:cytochrome o ubiquinol oxidase subunit 2